MRRTIKLFVLLVLIAGIVLILTTCGRNEYEKAPATASASQSAPNADDTENDMKDIESDTAMNNVFEVRSFSLQEGAVSQLGLNSDKSLIGYSDGLAMLRYVNRRGAPCWGFQDANGNIVIELQENWQPMNFQNGYAIVENKKDDMFYLIDKQGAEIPLHISRSEYIASTYFEQGMVWFCQWADGPVKLVAFDAYGNLLSEIFFPADCSAQNYGYFLADTNANRSSFGGKLGVDMQNGLITWIQHIDDVVSPDDQSITATFLYCVSDLEGNIIIDDIAGFEMRGYNDGLAVIGTPGIIAADGTTSSLYGCVDMLGNIVIAQKHESLGTPSCGLISYMENGKYGYLDYEGKVVIAAQFDYAEDFQFNLAGVKVGGKFGLIDINGRFMLEPMLPKSVCEIYEYGIVALGDRDTNVRDLYDFAGRLVCANVYGYDGGDVLIADNGQDTQIFKLIGNEVSVD